MNLHEYQAKSILTNYGVRVQRGLLAQSPSDAVDKARQLGLETGTSWYVVKAQIHAGGRGKGGGIKLAKNLDEVYSVSKQIIGMDLVTPQTSKQGKRVNQVFIAEDCYYPNKDGEKNIKEFYVSILLDRARAQNMIMYSTEGGIDIEQVAESTPHLIYTEYIDPNLGLLDFQARRVAFNLGLSGNAYKEMLAFLPSLYRAYVESDLSLIEINPVLKTSDDKILAVDAKISIDDNALYRHKDIQGMRDIREESPVEVEAKAAGLNYVSLEGNVGCMVNGAGLAMATMDLIKQSGGSPANFLDVGGTADAKRVETAFRMILKDAQVKAILVNVFGGIVRCDRVAQGIVDACKNMGGAIGVPVIIRLQGTNAEIAKDLIDKSDLPVHSVIQFKEAADKIKQVLLQ